MVFTIWDYAYKKGEVAVVARSRSEGASKASIATDNSAITFLREISLECDKTNYVDKITNNFMYG